MVVNKKWKRLTTLKRVDVNPESVITDCAFTKMIIKRLHCSLASVTNNTFANDPLTRHKANGSCEGLWYVVKTKHHAPQGKHQNSENPKAFINLLTAGTLEEWTGRDLYVDWLIM